MLKSADEFQHEVNFIYTLPALVLIEWGVLFLPILFHAVLGVWFASSGKSNVNRYVYQDNWRYSLQRISGYIGVLFIFMHITSLRFGWSYAGLMPSFDHHAASSSTAAHFQSKGLLIPLFYLVCVLSLVFHFANGLWTAAITWGLTISESAQRRWGVVCAGLGVALMVAAWSALGAAWVADYDDARRVEEKLIVEKHGEDKLRELTEKYPAKTTEPDPSLSALPQTEGN